MKVSKQLSADRFAALLREAKLKVTPGRIAVLRALAALKYPTTAEDLLAKLKKAAKKDAPDQATVYRALKELKDANLIRQIDFQHGHAHYELAGEKDHHHLVCIACERVEDFTGCKFPEITKAAMRQSKEFKEVLQHSLELFGICKSCARK